MQLHIHFALVLKKLHQQNNWSYALFLIFLKLTRCRTISSDGILTNCWVSKMNVGFTSSSFPKSGLQTNVTQRDLPLDYLTLTLALHLSRAVGPMVTKKQRVTTETTPICMEGEEKTNSHHHKSRLILISACLHCI